MRGFQRPSFGLMAAGAAMIFGLGYGAWLNQYGSFAKSPQVVTLTLGGTAIVAGGKAKVWFGALDDRVYVEFTQKDECRPLWLSAEEPDSEVCGLNVKLLTVSDSVPPKIKLQVRWQED